MGRYRSCWQILAEILYVVSDGAKKTHIMYRANLSYELVNRYLNEAVKAGLIEFDGESKYVITSRGLEFLKIYKVYEENNRKLEKHINELENSKEILERMLSS